MTDDNKKKNHIFKIILVGNSGVGKSNLMNVFMGNNFNSKSRSTIGIEYAVKNYIINNNNYEVQIWDTAGQEKYKSLTRVYYRSASGIILVFDKSNRTSFECLNRWLEDIYNLTDNPEIILAGNKCDLIDHFQIPDDEINYFCKVNNIQFIETSAKNNYNVNNLFDTIVNSLVKKNNSSIRKNTILNSNNSDEKENKCICSRK